MLRPTQKILHEEGDNEMNKDTLDKAIKEAESWVVFYEKNLEERKFMLEVLQNARKNI